MPGERSTGGSKSEQRDLRASQTTEVGQEPRVPGLAERKADTHAQGVRSARSEGFEPPTF